MKIKTFYQDLYETNEGLDARVNQFIESVKVLEVMTDATSCGSSECLIPRMTVTVIYEDFNQFNGSLVNKKYWGARCKLRQRYSLQY